MLKIFKEMMTAAANRVAVIIVSTAANKIEAAASISKAETDAEVEAEARKLEAQGFITQAQALRTRAGSIDADAPAATALKALANLTGTTTISPPAAAVVPQLAAATDTEVTPKRGPGRPKTANKPADTTTDAQTANAGK